jgi:chromate transport protein ChrA
LREIAREFLKLGATAYGGPAIMGIMQAELQEKRQLAVVLGHVTFGGGLTMIAFIQEQLVRQWHGLTPQEFIDGLALVQLTPGAIVGTVAAFLPSFVLMLAILPVVERARQIAWAKAAMSGIGPAVSARSWR